MVDASVLVESLLASGQARSRLDADEELHAPALIDLEVVQTLRGLVKGSRLTARRASESVSDLGLVDMARHAPLPLLARVWGLRDNLTAYDASYVALAERLGCTLVTADARIARASGPRCPIEVVD